MKKSQKGFTLAEMFFIGYTIIFIVALVGWVMNIVAVVHSSFETISGLLVARIIGIFAAPLGAVLGYF